MKFVKKLTALFLAVVMTMAMGISVCAANNITITNGDTGSVYQAYQLFTATVSTTGSGEDEKTNISYKINSKYESILREVTGKTASTDTDLDIQAVIAAYDAVAARTFADTMYVKITEAKLAADATSSDNVFSSLDNGYYMIIESTVGTRGETGKEQTGSVSLVMLDTVAGKDINVSTKEDVPSVVKKVQDKNDSTGATTGWQDSADYDIGDPIPYQITGTVSSKIDNYTGYYYSFVDEMTNLTYKTGSYKVTIDGNDVTGSFSVDFTNKVLTVTCADIKKIDGVTVTATSKVVLTYTATLDASANIGSQGNPNEVYLKYANNPYKNGDGTNDTGNTPKDKNIVFTYKTIFNKINENQENLAGAEFTLEKFVVDAENGKETYKNNKGDWKSVAETGVDATTSTFTFEGIDNGYYRLTETKAPDGYNKLTNPIYFEVSATHDETSDDPQLKTLNGNKLAGDVEITFTKDTSDEDALKADVPNTPGSFLPSTGGMGTTILYVAGIAMIMVAGVAVIVRKRIA